jgi:integrase
MSEKRIVVWVQHMADRPYLMLQWHEPLTGKRKSKSAGTCNPLEAEKLRADLEYELNHHLYQEASRMTWEAFRELFETEHVSATRENTQKNYRDMFDCFERLCQPKGLRNITERTISAFATAMRKVVYRGRVGLAPSTIRVRLLMLHAALSWGLEQKLLASVPTFPEIKVPRKKPQPVAVEAFERLFEKVEDAELRVFLLCGWLAGLRLVEAFSLEREPTTTAPWVDLANDRIVLPAEMVKGVEDQWVPLDPVLREALEALPKQGPCVFRFANARGSRDAEGNVRRVTPDAVSNRIIKLARAAGIRLTMRSLRRGFGCRYAGKVPAQVLQRLMRHANIATTMDYYANVDAAAMEAVLGTKRNTSRNTEPATNQKPEREVDATPEPTSNSGGY